METIIGKNGKSVSKEDAVAIITAAALNADIFGVGRFTTAKEQLACNDIFLLDRDIEKILFALSF